LPFHHYKDHIATPIEEHLKECIAYATSNAKSNLHFTVSEEHVDDFQAIVNQLLHQFQTKFAIEINVTYSFQKSATDVIALDKNNADILFWLGKAYQEKKEFDQALLYFSETIKIDPTNKAAQQAIEELKK
jgi:tetratricopeptide (TPR) repeat protein